MDSHSSAHRRNQSTPLAIPLQDLSHPRHSPAPEGDGSPAHRRTLSDRGRHLFRNNRETLATRNSPGQRYAPIDEGPPSPPFLRPPAGTAADAPVDPHDETPFSPIGGGFQEAIGFAGLSFGGMSSSTDPPPTRPGRASRSSLPTLRTVVDDASSLVEEDLDDGTAAFPSENETDTMPLTDAGRLRAASAVEPRTPSGQRHDRQHKSFQSIRFLSPTAARREEPFPDAEPGNLTPESALSRPRSASNRASSMNLESPLRRAGTVMRKMSMRVVNLSNEPEIVERSIRRTSSVSHERDSSPQPGNGPAGEDGSASIKSPVVEKNSTPIGDPELPPKPMARQPNPLRGKTLGIFSPESKIRLKLCDLLTHPFTEPFILVLIVAQVVLLAVDASKSVFDDPRSQRWGSSRLDHALLVLFSIYTIEIFVRVIVSGFVVNPVEYSTINRQIGLKKAVQAKADTLFALHRKPSINTGAADVLPQPGLLRTLTAQNLYDTPTDARYLQRARLAHRAYLRHSFNRLDFLAVCSFWISFWIGIFGVESTKHLYVFRMLSCLRILRLLSITAGTSVILRSMKRAMPILLNVSFLICFFWLLFAIIGVQSFKSSLRRTCVWRDTDSVNPQPDYAQNQTGNFQFCGGWLHSNGTGMPYALGGPDGQLSSGSPKGYWCPINSICVEQTNPYNGTVSYDNLLQSLELVFVIMTSNTFSDLLYYLTDSDYLAAALFSTFGIIILTFWLVNLLIAVITSSFQVIREESKASAFAAEQDTDKLPDMKTIDVPKRRETTMQKAYFSTRWLWIAVIVYGLVAQSLRSATMSDDRAVFIDTSELIVTFILDFEILFRFVADWRGFFTKKQNMVDLGLALMTSVIQIPAIHSSGTPYAWLTIFQILRIYRVVLALRVTRELIMVVLGNFYGLANLILFVFLLTFLAAIFATQMFRGELPQQDDYGNTLQVTFFTIWNAFLGMYQILSSENWTTIMYNVTAFNVSYDNGWIGAAFCILWYILANFVVLNMFIAVIQENFDVSEDEKRLQQVKAFLQQKRFIGAGSGSLSLSTIFKFGQVRRQDPLDFGSAATEMLLKDAVVKDFLDDADEPSGSSTPPSTTATARPVSHAFDQGITTDWWSRLKESVFNREPNPFYSRLQLSSAYQDLDPRQMAKEIVLAADRRKIAQREYLKKHPNYNVSLFLFRPDHPVRHFCQKIVGTGRGSDRIQGVAPSAPVWYAFSAFIYAAIVAMVLLACVTTPLYQREYFTTHNFSRQNWFVWADMGFAALFTIEAAIKVIADGFFWTPNAYFRGSWGFVDGIVLVTLWINVLALLYDPGGGSRAVGAFKALRALRLLNVSDSARDTLHSVIVMGGWKVISAAFVSLSLLIPFAIYGLNLFSGRMLECNDNNGPIYNLTDCVGEYMSSPYNWDVLAPRQVANSYYSFDDFGSSLFILFQIVSQEGWIDVMWSAQSITGVFTQPNPFTSQGNAVFFVIFNLLGAVFVLTLFVSVFMRNYTEQTGVAFLTTEQRSWLELRKLLRQVSPSKRPSSKKQRESWKEWCYRRAIKKNGRWQRFITALLVVHVILLCLEWYPDGTIWLKIRDYLFLALTLVYIANIAIRIVGLSWTRFRKSAWDVYGVISVFGTFITTILLLSNYRERDYIQIHKLFLVSVALLIIPRNNQLDQLFKTAAASLTSIGNLLATWFVLFLVFAIALTQTFGLTRFNSNETGNVNFRSVPKALILLFRTSVGEGWNQLMNDFATVVPPFCTVGEHYYDGDCGSENWSRALFIAWNILSMYLFVNLFVSLIYESFSYVYQRSSGLSVISREEIRRFKQAWAEFDPNGTGYISKTAFPRLLGELSGVFEMRIYDGDFSVRNILEDCRLKPNRATALSFDGQSDKPVIDLEKLNQRLAELPIDEIRKRRTRMNTFYEEVLVSADPDRGVEFNALLMILAHYKVINDNKSLRLEEFLRRRARLQRVDEAVRRNIVKGFFDTLYWSRRFRRRIDSRKEARLTAVPAHDFDVPEIFVQDESESPQHAHGIGISPLTPMESDDAFFSTPRSSGGGRTTGASAGNSPGSVGVQGGSAFGDSPASGTGSVLRHRSDSIQISPSASPTRNRFGTLPGGPGSSSSGGGVNHSPALSQGSFRDDWQLANAMSNGPPSPGHLASGDAASDGAGGARSRAGSAVSAQEVLDVLDNSAWGESIRRSFTLRRPSQNDGSGGGGRGGSVHRRVS